MLQKGHGKDNNLSSTYRFHSQSCRYLSGGALKEDWKSCQADTQFQGEGMSHELAALLLTKIIHHSLTSKKPTFVLLLDGRSAFDLVLRQILIRRLYLDTQPDQRILYWDHRLSNRMTFCWWEDQLMGPIDNELGVDQGGTKSSEQYKIYNLLQLALNYCAKYQVELSTAKTKLMAFNCAETNYSKYVKATLNYPHW